MNKRAGKIELFFFALINMREQEHSAIHSFIHLFNKPNKTD